MIKQIILSLLVLIYFASCKNNSTDNKPADIDTTSNISPVKQLSIKIRKNPYNNELFKQRAEEYIKENKIDSAINDYELAKKLDTLDQDVYLRLADLYLLSSKSEKSKNQLEKCLKINPKNTKALINLARIYLYVDNYKKSNEYLIKAEKINDTNAEIYLLRGLAYQALKDTNKAIKNFQIAVEKNPDYYEPYNILGILYAAKNDTVAIEYYKNAIKLQPKNPQPHYNLALFLQNQGYEIRALNEYNHIITKIDTAYSDAYFNMGYVNMLYLKNYKKAISYFSKVINLQYTDVRAYYNRGYCYEKLKDYKNARIDYSTALKISRNYQLAIDGLNRLEKL